MSETKEKKPRAVKSQPQQVKQKMGLPKKEDGSVDWRKIVSKSNINLNPYYYAKRSISVDSLSDEEKERLKENAPDEALLILLSGFREIAKERGVKSVFYKLEERVDTRAVVSCSIVLVPTEDEPYEVTISGISNASIENTYPEFFVHAEAIASNRASNRAWREYLNISAMSFDEINPNDKVEVSKAPDIYIMLKDLCQANRIETCKFRELMNTYGDGKKINDEWDGTIGDLSPAEKLTLIGIIKSLEEQ